VHTKLYTNLYRRNALEQWNPTRRGAVQCDCTSAADLQAAASAADLSGGIYMGIYMGIYGYIWVYMGIYG